MRQAGVIAAPGIVGLTEMVSRLKDAHDNAGILAAGIAQLPGTVLDRPRPDTNIVIFRLESAARAETFAGALEAEGVLVSDFGAGRLRLVTHYGISGQDCRAAIEIMKRVWASLS